MLPFDHIGDLVPGPETQGRPHRLGDRRLGLLRELARNHAGIIARNFLTSLQIGGSPDRVKQMDLRQCDLRTDPVSNSVGTPFAIFWGIMCSKIVAVFHRPNK